MSILNFNVFMMKHSEFTPPVAVDYMSRPAGDNTEIGHNLRNPPRLLPSCAYPATLGRQRHFALRRYVPKHLQLAEASRLNWDAKQSVALPTLTPNYPFQQPQPHRDTKTSLSVIFVDTEFYTEPNKQSADRL
jgi:hypothetical protein